MTDKKRKRRTQRVPGEVPIRLLRKNRMVDAVAVEFNEDGMFIRTDVKAPLGSLIQIELLLPDGMAKATTMFVSVRSISEAEGAEGLGVGIYVAGSAERRRWATFYQNVVRRSGAHRLVG